MLAIISPLASSIIFTKSKNEKAANPEVLLDIFRGIKQKNGAKAGIISSPRKALNYAKRTAGKNELVVVCGSIYVVGEAVDKF